MRAFPTFLLALAAAGCLGAPSEVAPAATSDVAEAQLASFVASGCSQVHSYFPSPAEAFRSFVPEGFTLITSDPAGATVLVAVQGTSCPDGSDVWVELPVEPADPPATEADHVVPVVAYADGIFLERYLAWGLEDLVLEVEHIALYASAGGAYELHVQTTDEDYKWRGRLDQGSGSFDPWAAYRWIAIDGEVAGHIFHEQPESANVGFGPASMVYVGSGGAPPVAGGIAHVVEGVELTTTWEVLR